MDRLLSSVIARAARRGMAGEPVWLAVAVTLWVVRRARRRPPAVVWSGRLSPGQRLQISAYDPGDAGASPSAGG